MGVITAIEEHEDDFNDLKSTAKLVLPPKRIDGRVDVSRNVVVGAAGNKALDVSDDDRDEVIIVVESDSDAK
jgi:hypothetical protein